MLTLDQFQYDLPTKCIAQEPAHPRDHARLMLIHRQEGTISHHHVYDLPSLLPSGYDIVANNTKVFPARMRGTKATGGQVEILLLAPLGHSRYHCLTRPGLKVGDVVQFAATGTVLERNSRLQAEKGSPADERTVPQVLSGSITHLEKDGMERTIAFDCNEGELKAAIAEVGTMPTPPYIKKMVKNPNDYQTIYAKYGFSAAAPTAGLHFTPQLLQKLKHAHRWDELTLNVGLGTFLPVKTEYVTEHPMHSELFTISSSAAAAMNASRRSGKRRLVVGTTTLRALESAVDELGSITPVSKSTKIYIYPPYRFRATDALMTNFHLPGSTLLMLVSAFVSYPQTDTHFTNFHDSLLGYAYAEAVRLGYRFFSFGDAMLIL